MKTVGLTTRVKTTIIIVATLFAFAVNTNAQNAKTAKNTDPVFTENSIKSIINGIHSEILGIRKQCIYLAGMYQLNKTADDLTDQLEVEKEPKIRALIAFALFKIGDEKGIRAVYSAYLKETDKFANHMLKSVVCQYYSDRIQRLSMK